LVDIYIIYYIYNILYSIIHYGARQAEVVAG